MTPQERYDEPELMRLMQSHWKPPRQNRPANPRKGRTMKIHWDKWPERRAEYLKAVGRREKRVDA